MNTLCILLCFIEGKRKQTHSPLMESKVTSSVMALLVKSKAMEGGSKSIPNWVSRLSVLGTCEEQPLSETLK